MPTSKSKNKNKDARSQQLREHVAYLLNGGGAHATFEEVIKDLPEKLRGVKPDGLPHSAWMLIDHLRIAQWDILEFRRNPNYKPREWPREYWPTTIAPPSSGAWDKSVRQFRRDLKAMQEMVTNPKTDLFAKIPWGEGQTILREALLVADHNAYHLGQLLDGRRLLGAWSA
jgi:hypothetical protein